MAEIKKNPVGRPAVNATPITVRVPPDLLEQLDRLCEEAHASRPEAFRFVLRSYLEAQGQLEQPARLERHYTVSFMPSEVAALNEVFGPRFSDHQEGIEKLVRDWLHNQSKSPSE